MLAAVLCVAALGHLVLGENPQVTTSYGTMKGQVLKSRDGRDFFSFTRIPYAKPPVGERRFMISEKVDNWTGILDATQPIPPCFSPDGGQEDCLYLNVFSPNLTGGYPVIFSIYGGAFLGGSALVYGSAKFFMDEDVIFVAPNYRVGPLGFLSLEDKLIPGNYGIKDQALALEWVHKEIKAFGGDPNRITVIGGSSGAASTDIICSAPRTNGLIKSCVSQSGVGSAPWTFVPPGLSREMALNMAKTVGCAESRDLLKCLQSKPMEQVGKIDLMKDNNQKVHLTTPVLEPAGAPGAIVTSWPIDTNHKYPWILGVCQDEGMVMTGDYELKKKSKEEAQKFINEFNQTIITTYHLENRPDDVRRIRERYFKEGVEPLVAIRNYFTEYMFLYPSLKSISKHPGPTYFYKFNYTRKPEISSDINLTVAPHGSEMPYFFESKSTNPDWPNAADIALSKQLVKMWVNFARDQTPSSQGTIQWPQFQGQYYLDIQDSGVTISNWTGYQETLDFWKSIVPDEPSESSTTKSSLLLVAAMGIFFVYKTIL